MPEILTYHKKEWMRDLYKLWNKPNSLFPTRYNGKIELWLNSQEEVNDLVEFFTSHGLRVFVGECIGRKERVWYDSIESIGDSVSPYDVFQIFILIKNKKDYISFKELLIGKELKSKGYTCFQQFGEWEGIYTKEIKSNIKLI